jgi:hydroxymethylpyrimidine pyrophosphatase-like HAD family hydrolase
MGAEENSEAILKDFIEASSFRTKGAVITDLDGTAVHEFQGKIVIPKEVEYGLLHHYRSGRPIVLNSLRFPLSVLRTFGTEWYKLSNAPIPTVTLNGSLIGHIKKTTDEELEFVEVAAFPLTKEEITSTLKGVQNLIDAGFNNVVLFYYPRDWRIGEVIWTPSPQNIIPLKEKYTSASAVTAVELDKLGEQLTNEDICMMVLLIDAPEDQLMAYQHTQRNNFITHHGIDKLQGALKMGEVLDFELSESLGAGDTPMDTFLSGVGLATIVGPMELNFRGLRNTIKLSSSIELGLLLYKAYELAH